MIDKSKNKRGSSKFILILYLLTIAVIVTSVLVLQYYTKRTIGTEGRCGDKFCDEDFGETCRTCSTDCGQCFIGPSVSITSPTNNFYTSVAGIPINGNSQNADTCLLYTSPSPRD